ncbi:hypothetical protein ES702_00414 [subsurface metagenome]
MPPECIARRCTDGILSKKSIVCVRGFVAATEDDDQRGSLIVADSEFSGMWHTKAGGATLHRGCVSLMSVVQSLHRTYRADHDSSSCGSYVNVAQRLVGRYDVATSTEACGTLWRTGCIEVQGDGCKGELMDRTVNQFVARKMAKYEMRRENEVQIPRAKTSEICCPTWRRHDLRDLHL